MNTLGIHHVTGFCGSALSNIKFYEGLLGLRLVKRTVNFDDPESPHLYYGDGLGRPGTIITFFANENSKPGMVGRQQFGLVAFAVPTGSLEFWQNRLESSGISTLKVERNLNGITESALQFADRDGLLLEVVETDFSTQELERAHSERIDFKWDGSGITVENAIFSVHRVEMWLGDIAATEKLLTEAFGFTRTFQSQDISRTRLSQEGLSKNIDLIHMPDRHTGFWGAGTIHHVALATNSVEDHASWKKKVREFGVATSPVYDRNYFDSIYMREPGGTILEIATMGPGFNIDESPEELGKKLQLPIQVESQRAKLEQKFADWMPEMAKMESQS